MSVDRYAAKRRRVARVIAKWNTGTITLTRTTAAASEPETPWIPGEPSTDVYALDARLDGVTADMIDGTTITATDLVAITSPRARHTLSNGEAADGAVADIVPTESDILTIDGREKTIKRVVAYPAAGPAALFHVFIAS